MTQMNISIKRKQTHRHREETCSCQEGGRLEEKRIGSLGIAAMYRLLYLKSITNNDLLFSKGNSSQYSVITERI